MVINHTLKGELTSSLEVSRLTSRFTEGKDWKLHSYCRNVRKRQTKKKTVRATETEIANNLYMNWQEKNRISDEISELSIWVCCNIFKFYKSLNRSGYKGCFIFLRQNVLTFPQQTSAWWRWWWWPPKGFCLKTYIGWAAHSEALPPKFGKDPSLEIIRGIQQRLFNPDDNLHSLLLHYYCTIRTVYWVTYKFVVQSAYPFKAVVQSA